MARKTFLSSPGVLLGDWERAIGQLECESHPLYDTSNTKSILLHEPEAHDDKMPAYVAPNAHL